MSEDPEALRLHGLRAYKAGNSEEAVQALAQAVAIDRNNASLYGDLGAALHAAGRVAEASDAFRRGLRLDARNASLYYNLGNVLREQESLDRSESCYLAAIRLEPNHAYAHNNLGLTLEAGHRYAEARVCYRRALSLDENCAEAYNNLGNLTVKEGHDLAEAVALFERAIMIKPEYADAYSNLGNALQEWGRFEEALASYERATQIDSNSRYYTFHASLVQLALGNIPLAWEDYDHRFYCTDNRLRHTSIPRWNGQDLKGKSILVYGEQGLGDTLQYIRYGKLLKSEGATVVFHCRPGMQSILQGVPGLDLIASDAQGLPRCDFQTPLLSLPRVFQTSISDIPAEVPYIRASDLRLERWARQLDDRRPHFRIGIAWQGNPDFQRDQFRSIPLDEFAPLALPGVQLYSLQKGIGAEQIDDVAFAVNRPGDEVDVEAKFVDTAAIIQSMDLIVTSDTSIAHLAGSLAAAVWTVLSHSADPRWFLDRTDCPWYPTMRLWRQRSRGDWAGIFSEMGSEVAALAASSSPASLGSSQA